MQHLAVCSINYQHNTEQSPICVFYYEKIEVNSYNTFNFLYVGAYLYKPDDLIRSKHVALLYEQSLFFIIR
jgi:hypothetical protein